MLVVLGFLFIGLSLITLIGANWDAIPRAARMVGLLVLTAGTHGVATHLHLSGKARPAVALFLLGNLFYGASIILIAQIYHLGEHIPDGVFVWALGSLPFAVVLCNAWLTLLSGLLALTWFVLEFRTGFLSATFFVSAFPLFLVAESYVLTKGRANPLLFLVFVASLVLWFETALALMWADGGGRLEYTSEHAFVAAALFILAYSVGRRLDMQDSAKARDHGTVLSLWSLRFALLLLIVLSFDAPWEQVLSADWDHQTSMWIIIAAVVAAALWIGWKSASRWLLFGMTVESGTTMIAVVATGTGRCSGVLSGARERNARGRRNRVDLPRYGERDFAPLLPRCRDRPVDRIRALHRPAGQLRGQRNPVHRAGGHVAGIGVVLETSPRKRGWTMTRAQTSALLCAAIAFQMLVLVGMVARAALPLWTGTEVHVATVPVDPRSMFRGDYVQLRYELGTLPSDAFGEAQPLRVGQVVYVSLTKGADDRYGFAGASLEKPAGGKFLRGRIATDHAPIQVRYGIEAFFASKEEAARLERGLLEGGVAVLMVSPDGRAALKAVVPSLSPPGGSE